MIILNVYAFLHLSQPIGLKQEHLMEPIGNSKAINPNLIFSASRAGSFEPQANLIAADADSPFKAVIGAIKTRLQTKRTIQAAQRVRLSLQHLSLFSHSAHRYISRVVSQAISVTTLRSLTATPIAPPMRSFTILHSFFVECRHQL